MTASKANGFGTDCHEHRCRTGLRNCLRSLSESVRRDAVTLEQSARSEQHFAVVDTCLDTATRQGA